MSHLTNLQSRMKAGEVEAVLVSSEINQRYLTGLNYTDGYVLVLPEAAYLLADFRYIEVARATAGSAGIEVVMPEGGMLPCVAGLLEKHAVRHLAYEEETVSCALRIRFAETFPGVELMTGASRLIDSLRLFRGCCSLQRRDYLGAEPFEMLVGLGLRVGDGQQFVTCRGSGPRLQLEVEAFGRRGVGEEKLRDALFQRCDVPRRGHDADE